MFSLPILQNFNIIKLTLHIMILIDKAINLGDFVTQVIEVPHRDQFVVHLPFHPSVMLSWCHVYSLNN